MDISATRPTPEELVLAEEVLLRAPLAFVAMVEHMAFGEPSHPYVVPMNFAYVPASAQGPALVSRHVAPGRLFLHTGAGRKTRALAGNPAVSIAVTTDEDFRKGASACEDGFAFRSVLIEGRALLLGEALERDQALRAIVAKYDPGAVASPFTEDALAETLVYAVEIDILSYKERPRRS